MNRARWMLLAVVFSVMILAFVVYRATAAKSRASTRNETVANSGNSGSGTHEAAPPSIPIEISQRGPGMHPQGPDVLKFPVPRTLDLTYVTAANFATALGDDPLRIFNYVRDEIAFESYVGCLRGSRGTLLALAGNSVDRASLLASMLQHAGQRVRFAHGTLPEPLARELVTSMWAERPELPANTNTSDTAKVAVEKLVNSVQRDYKLIRDQLQKANVAFNSQSVPSLDSLIKETEDHYWVQWSKNGNWVDLDPSFGDSTPGAKYAAATETLDALPEGLYHQVEIRIRIEEYTGNQASSRVVLTRTAKAADLSGVTVLLAHEPENWNGPAESLQAALASAIQDTGRIKPVLFLGGESWAAGAPFYPKSPPTSGMGGIFNALAGVGTRHDAAIASAESIDIDLISPNGQKETVTRNIFDLVGSARRAKNVNLTYDDLRTKADANDAIDLSASVYGLFFSTGAIATKHVLSTIAIGPTDQPEAVRTLQRFAVTFNLMSDTATNRIGPSQLTATYFYFNSPRLTVIDVSKSFSGKVGFTIDLRRDSPRAVALGQRSNVELGRVARGIMDGALERFLLDSVAGIRQHSETRIQVKMSTSGLFDLAETQHVVALALPAARNRLSSAIPEDTLARVGQDTAKGFLLIAPERSVSIAGAQRYAWWRVDPKSGETIAVTDDGLYAAEMFACLEKDSKGQVMAVKVYFEGALEEVFVDLSEFAEFQPQNVNAPGGLSALLQALRDAGITFVQHGLY